MKKIVLFFFIFLYGCNYSNNNVDAKNNNNRFLYDSNTLDENLYNLFVQSFTNGTVNAANSYQLEVLNNDNNYIIGFLSGSDLNKERLILHESSTFIVLGKTEEKQFDSGNYTSIITYISKSKISLINKVILKYKDPAKCGVFIDIEYYNNKNEIIFSSNGFVRSFC